MPPFFYNRSGDPCCFSKLGYLITALGVTWQHTLFENPMNSDEIIKEMSSLRVTQGSRIGETFTVLPWQRRFIKNAFRENVEIAGLSVARGNGKTTLIAGICTSYLLHKKLYNADVIVVASSFSQARICFDQVIRFLRIKYNSESLKKVFRIQDSQNNAVIENRFSGLRLRCMGSDSKRLHGLQFQLAILDEGAQWILGGQKIYNAISTSLGKLHNARILAIGTKPTNPDHWFSKLLDDETTGYSQIHEIEKECKTIFQKRTWKKANPSLEHLPDLARAIKRESLVAKKDFNAQLSFRAYRLNQGTDEDAQDTYLISPETWRDCEVDVEREGLLVWGVDLSGGSALSALSAYWIDSGYLESMALVGDDPSLAKRGEIDSVGSLYLKFADEGSLITSKGRAADIDTLLREGLTRYGQPDVIIADRYKINEFSDAINRVGIDCEVGFRGMGFRDGSEDVERFRRACLQGRVKAKKQLIARHCFAGCRVVSDPAGNEKISKNTQGGRRLRHRDDCAVSSVLAVAAGDRINERLNKIDFDIVIV